MSQAKRKPLLEKIRKHIVEEGECWVWTGAVQSGCGCVPTMNHNGKVGAVRRFILEEQGVVLGKRLATYTCGNENCVKLADNARKRAKLTLEIAAEIRAAEGTQREIAERFGVSQSVVGRVIRGTGWLTYASPWAGLGAL